MFLYHGSHLEVKNPKIRTSARTGDFGTGFYLTSNLEQARRWAQIRARQEEVVSGVVTIYETPDSLLKNPELQIKQFAKADDKWLDFVMSNRKDPNFNHHFDLVTGPVANDRVYACLNAFEDGFMNRETVIENLKTYVLVDQFLFHTAKSLLFLNYSGKEDVSCSRK